MNIILNPSLENTQRLSQKSLPPLPSTSEASPLHILEGGSREATSEKSHFIEKWPRRPQNLHRGGILAALSCTGDAFTIIISCVFFVYGAFVVSYDGVATSSVPHLSLLQDAARYVGAFRLFHTKFLSSPTLQTLSRSYQWPSASILRWFP